jgi:hypothetical protein
MGGKYPIMLRFRKGRLQNLPFFIQEKHEKANKNLIQISATPIEHIMDLRRRLSYLHFHEKVTHHQLY